MTFTNKILSAMFITYSFLIDLSSEGPCFITTKVTKYKSCRDKDPSDTKNQYCCYLVYKSGGNENKKCVELNKTDVDDGKFKDTKDKIKAKTLEDWKSDSVKDFYDWYDKDEISEVKTLRCKDGKYIKFFGAFSLILIALLW